MFLMFQGTGIVTIDKIFLGNKETEGKCLGGNSRKHGHPPWEGLIHTERISEEEGNHFILWRVTVNSDELVAKYS